VSSSCSAPLPESHTSDAPAQKHLRLLNSAARKLHSSGERRPRALKLPVWTRLRDRLPGLDGPRSRRTCLFDFHRGAARRRQGVLNTSTSSSAEQGTRMVTRGTETMSRGGGALSGDNDVGWVQLACLGRGGVEFSWSGLHGPQQAWGPNLDGGGAGARGGTKSGRVRACRRAALRMGWV
jgi:hypothetical protein